MLKLYLGPADDYHLTLAAEGALENGDATTLLHSQYLLDLLTVRPTVLFDLQAVARYDAAGLASLKELRRRAAAMGTDVVFVNVPVLDLVFFMSVVFLQAEPLDFAYRA